MKLIKILLTVFILSCSTESNTNPEHKSWTAENRGYLIKELQRSRDDMALEVKDISDKQWHFRESDDRWSIAEIIEHQELQDQLFYRELNVLVQFPEMLEYLNLANGTDENVLEYRIVTTQNTGKAPWYLVPVGKYCDKQLSIDSFLKLRNEMIDFVSTTKKDLRKYVTPSGRGSAKMRDLHQLLLVTSAHTDRHTSQIRMVKEHNNYPKE